MKAYLRYQKEANFHNIESKYDQLPKMQLTNKKLNYLRQMCNRVLFLRLIVYRTWCE